ncbi:MAG: FecR family protein, partial [Syntrophorhabdaceae bacterium]|nr:FecR family protein [Syntrophorhabdaceae bacterium]
MKRIWKFYSFFMIIFILSAGLLQAAPVGKITNLEGKVDVLKVGKNAATPVSLGDPVDVGDIYRAKSNSKAEITFINNNLLRIAPNTRIEIKEYMVQGDQSSGVAKLHRGRAQIVAAEEFIKKAAAFAEGNKFEIHTPNAVAGIRGTNMIVFHERGLTGVLFVSGRGYIYNPTVPDKVVPVTAGNISFVTAPTAPPTPPAKASEAEITKQVNAVTIPAKTTVVKAEVAEKAPQAPAEAPKAATVVTTKEPAETVETTKITTTVTTEKLFQETTTQAQVVKTTGIVTLPQTTIPSIQQTPAVITTSTTKQTDVPPVTQQVAQEERPPVVKITSQPDPLTNVNTATFTLTADKNASFAYNLNSAGWVSIATGNQSTLTLQNIPEGQNSIIFRATDPLTGKFSETSSFSWKTDYTLPDVKVTQNVSPGTNNTSQMKVDFTTTNKPQGYVSYEYRLDGGPWVVVSGSSAIIQNIINGTHTIEYRAKDKAGNTVSSSLSFESKTYSLPSSIAGTGFTGTSKTDFSILSGTGQVSGVATNTGAYTTTLTLQGTLPPQPKINLGGTGSYWMENMKMNVSGDNVTGQSEFIYISGKELATGTGTITGSKGASGQWNATSTGTWNSASLIYSGAMDHTQAFISPGEGASNQSRIKGLLGTTKNITFAGVGEFDDQGLRAFGAPVTGKNWDTGAYSTSGLFGLRLGSDSETVNTMKARMLGIYVKPLGNNRYEAGYLDTGLASSDTPAGGQFYRDINMWKINSGILTEEKKTASDIISPISPVVDYSSTLIQGTINLGGQYQGIVQGNILSIKDQPWGVFIAGFGGYNETTPATIISGGKIEGQGENGYWIARGDITKNEDVAFYAPFKKGNFLTNNYIGQLKDGEFFGTYENGPYTCLLY